MAALYDERAVERALSVFTLSLPRTPQRGRVGEVRAQSVGSSMELHDFRTYQPGDDLRQLDWNAVARTGELVLRVRQDEVSPRFEVVVDGSRSMAVSPQKEARARELCLLFLRAAARAGLEPTLISTGARPDRQVGLGAESAARSLSFDGRDPLPESSRRAPPLRMCGLRVVVSDFLYEAGFDRHLRNLSRQSSGVVFVQLLDPEEVDPPGGFGARLTDVETGEALERILTESVIDAYKRKLEGHQRLVAGAVQRAGARLCVASAGQPVDALARTSLRALAFSEGRP